MSGQGGDMASMPSSGPYPPTTWALGGAPERKVDIPVQSIFLVLFILLAATHMTIFQINQRRGHKFVFSAMMFGFCMARIVTSTLRLASTTHPTNLNLAIAAQIFTAAGVLLLYIINLVWTQRILRSLHPAFGWHRLLSLVFKALYALIIATLIIVITATVQSFFTLDPHIRSIDRALQLYGGTLFAIVSFLPLPILATVFAFPRRAPHDRFGAGRLRTKVCVLVTGATLLCFGAAYRAGTSWKTPVPRSEPLPDYFAKGAFYIVNFGVEVLTVAMYAAVRVDMRFHVPNGAKGGGSYSSGNVAAGGGGGSGSVDGNDLGESGEGGAANGRSQAGQEKSRAHGGHAGWTWDEDSDDIGVVGGGNSARDVVGEKDRNAGVGKEGGDV